MKRAQLLVPIATALLLVAPWGSAADSPPVEDSPRKARLIAAPAEKTPAPASALATPASVLLGMAVAAVLVWRFSGGARRRRRQRGFGRLARRSRLGQPLTPGDNPFDDDPPVR